MATKKRVGRSSEEVQQLLKGYEESGLSRREYCQDLGIPITTLDYYRRRRANKQARQRLVAVEVAPQPARREGGFALVLGNGRRIECGWGFAEPDLARLLRIVERT